MQKCDGGCGLPDIALGSVHDLLSADPDVLNEWAQFLVPDIVELDQESIVGDVPPDGEPPQARQHHRRGFVIECLFSLL